MFSDFLKIHQAYTRKLLLTVSHANRNAVLQSFKILFSNCSKNIFSGFQASPHMTLNVAAISVLRMCHQVIGYKDDGTRIKAPEDKHFCSSVKQSYSPSCSLHHELLSIQP